MRILITGICGFVGSVLAQGLVEARDGIELLGMDNFIRPGSMLNREPITKIGIKLIHGDIRMASDFENLPKLDYIIDAAANPSVLAGIDGKTSSRQLIEHNLSGTINILERCKFDGAGLILLSTSRVYSIPPLASLPVQLANNAFLPDFKAVALPGLNEQGINESFPVTSPVSLYGASKLSSENLALEYGHAFNFPVWINRCGVLAGGGQFGRADQGINSYWINSWAEKKALKYIGFKGHGYQVRDCLHPRDMIGLILKQIDYQSRDKVQVQNISGGMESSASLAQLSQWCTERFGYRTVESDLQPRQYDIPWLVLNSDLARSQWGWKPEMNKTIIWEEIARHAMAHPDWLTQSAPY